MNSFIENILIYLTSRFARRLLGIILIIVILVFLIHQFFDAIDGFGEVARRLKQE